MVREPKSRRFSVPSVGVLVLLIVNVAIINGVLTAQTVTVDATPDHSVNSFSPPYALGTTVDRVPSNATDTFFSSATIQQILEAGWGVVSYSQNTELFVQAWHGIPREAGAIEEGRAILRAMRYPERRVVGSSSRA